MPSERARRAASHVAAQEPEDAGGLIAAAPMRALLAEENGKAAAAAAAEAGGGGRAEAAAAAAAHGGAVQGMAAQELAACESRLAAAVEAIGAQLHDALNPVTLVAPPTKKRGKRNVCRCSDGAHAPSAPTLEIAPGEGLPADHQMLLQA